MPVLVESKGADRWAVAVFRSSSTWRVGARRFPISLGVLAVELGVDVLGLAGDSGQVGLRPV